MKEIKIYFLELGNELSELATNIWSRLKTKKWIAIISLIMLFTIGCFIWKPLFPITFIGLMLLATTLCIMLIPITISTCVLLLFNLECLDDEDAKYPMLQFTLGIISSILTLCGTSYLAWDIAIRDMWINHEMWSHFF